MKKYLLSTLALVFVFAFAGTVSAANGGFDEFGYNNKARVFVGTCTSWHNGKYGGTLEQAQAYCGDYSNDRLVMKWNAAWDACNDAGNDDEEACAGAWVNNEWNGASSEGSGEVWHYKIIWVGSEGEDSPYWKEGGYLTWGNYETIMDQGVVTGEGPVTWYAHALPNGYGAN